MGGRKRRNEEGSDASMDMMTALIGCLILILIGILVIIMVSQALIVVVSPDSQKVQAIQTSAVDGLPEDKAFPDGNIDKEPTYIDVHRDHLVIYPGKKTVTRRQLEKDGNAFERKIKALSKQRAERYVVFMVRPYAAKLARTLRKKVIEEDLLDVGTELVNSKFVFAHDSKTEELLEKELKEQEEAEKAEKAAEAAETTPTPDEVIAPADENNAAPAEENNAAAESEEN